ncbi:MAG: HAD hydrolase-like protein [Planctomycetaceae bacterium]
MHVCLFDIDGTLLDTGGAGQAAMEAALADEFGVTRAVTGIPAAGRTDRAITRDLLAFHDLPDDETHTARLLTAYLRHLPEHLANRRGAVLPGIAEILAGLDQREDVLVGLLTGNYRAGARVKLGHYALEGYFRFGGYGDRHHDRCDVAREALVELQVHHDGAIDLERLWVIGDTPADVRCGRAIGAKVVAVGTGIHPLADLEASRPDHLFENFRDPRGLLDLLA